MSCFGRRVSGSILIVSMIFASLGARASAAFVGETPSQDEIDAVIQESADRLVGNQEVYMPDSLVGTLSASELETWQLYERGRLQRIRDRYRGVAVEWPYEGVYRVFPDSMIPAGYRVGGSSIVCEALLRARNFESTVRQDAFERCLGFMLDELESNPALDAGPKVGYDVRGWGHTYALSLFLSALELGAAGSEQARVETMIPDLIGRIQINEVGRPMPGAGGGWNYASDFQCSPFMTGVTLLTLYRANGAGFAVDPDLVDRALAALELGRDPVTGAYRYSGVLLGGGVPMPGSNARSAVAELALYKAGVSSLDRLRVGVDGFFLYWDELFARKSQQGTHVGPYGVAPYYFFFGHTYAAIAIESLPESERPEYREKLAALLFMTRDSDGSWNDRVFPRTESYSTAMVMLALLAPTLPAIPEWTGSGL